MPALPGDKKRRKTHHQILCVCDGKYLFTIISARQVQVTTISKNVCSWYLKRTRKFLFQPPIEHRHMYHPTKRWRNREHLNIVPTRKKQQFPSSTPAEPDFEADIASRLFVVQGRPLLTDVVATTLRFKIGSCQGRPVRPGSWK